MKKINLVRKYMLIAPLALFSLISNAQEFESLISIGPQDLNTYMGKYIGPGMQSLGVGLAGGWNNTAKPHKLLGFDVTVGINVAGIPDDEKLFQFDNNDFENLTYSGTGSLPTFVGGPATGQLSVPASSTITGPNGESITISESIDFDAPDGLDVEDLPIPAGFPVPYVQVGVGLIKGTEVKIRFLPTSAIEGDAIQEARFFGWGILHDFKQWIPGMKLLPFDLSAFIGNTSMEFRQAADFSTSYGDAVNSTTVTADGDFVLSARATTFQVLISKKLAIFTPYAGIGLNSVKSSIKYEGDVGYDVVVNGGSATSQVFNNPIDLEFEGAGGPRLQVGARLKLLILTLHVDYTIQKYNTLTAGVGLSIR